jgi:hypothetical protein
MSDAEAARARLQRHLGCDWELALIAADALPSAGATLGAVLAAQLRAVDLVSEAGQDWSFEQQDLVAQAWQIVWLDSLVH